MVSVEIFPSCFHMLSFLPMEIVPALQSSHTKLSNQVCKWRFLDHYYKILYFSFYGLVQPCAETSKTPTWWLNLTKSVAQVSDTGSYRSLIFRELLPFYTALTKTGFDFIGSFSKSMNGGILSTPEGLPSPEVDLVPSCLNTCFAPLSIQY